MAHRVDIASVWPDAGSDPITLFTAKGYEALEALSGTEIAVPADRLLLPFDGTDAQVAAGINYPAHGEEVAVSDSFLFPKLSAAMGRYLKAGDEVVMHANRLGALVVRITPAQD